MKPIEIGATATRHVTVDPGRTVDFLGKNLRVYATPELVRDVEATCRDFLLDYADVGEDSVGTGIGLSHTGATLLGMNVEITATVAAVDGRRVNFLIVVRDDAEEISRGEHGRFVLEVEWLHGKLGAKERLAKPEREAG